MPIDPATGEEEEDLSKIEWGAGLSRLIDGQLPNIIFFGVGWSLLALPCYLVTGWNEEYLSKDSDVAGPLVISAIILLLCIGAILRLRAPLLAARAHESAVRRGGLSAPILPGGGPTLTSLPSHTDEIDTSWKGILGFTVYSSGRQRTVENAALFCATAGYVGFGCASGITTFCAYNKGHDLVYWEECYQVSRAFTGVHQTGGRATIPTHLPLRYFECLLLAMLATILGPLAWFVLWKVVRAAVRPARRQDISTTDDGLRELPQTAMFVLAASVGVIAGLGAWVFRQMIGLVHNILFMQESIMRPGSSNPFFYDANEHTLPPFGNTPLALIILSPVIGGIIVAFLVQNWAPEAKGHGVPEVMDAIHYKEGKIRPSVAGVKILASSFSIGSGGSVGREGPIIQIGSTFGSMVGVASGCSISQR